MHDTNLLEDQPIAWTPTPDVIERAQLTKFMRQVGVSTWDELYQFSIGDVEKFTEEVLKFLDIKFNPPYEKLLDTSKGIEFPRWFRRSESRSEDTPVLMRAKPEENVAACGDEDKSVLAPLHAGLNITEMCLDRWQTDEMKDLPAVIWEGEEGYAETRTYAELFEEVADCASGLRSYGFGKGDALGIHMPMAVETIVALLAINRIGAIAVPVFSGYGVDAIASRLNAVGARALITYNRFPRRGKEFRAFEVAKEAAAHCPNLTKVFTVGRNATDDYPDYASLPAVFEDYVLLEMEGSDADSTRSLPEPTSAEDPLIILYTSGTTGKPKGIAHTHASFPIKAAQDMAFGTDVGRGTRICWYTDIGWMMGPWLIYGALINGATICIYDGAPDYPTPDRMWEFCAKHKVEVLGISPTLVRALAAHGQGRSEGRSEDTPVLTDAASASGHSLSQRRGWSHHGKLPHFDGEVYQFVTFRLADSLPKGVLERLRQELKHRNLDDDAEEYRQRVEQYLDQGAGECLLKNPDIAEILTKVILHEDGNSCDLKAWVVMPNHVHLLLKMRQGHDLAGLMKRIKGVSARRINQHLNRTGSVWQQDYFDRYIRDAEHYSYVFQYIENNPVLARLAAVPEDWSFGSAANQKRSEDTPDRSEDTPVLMSAKREEYVAASGDEDKSVLAPFERHDLSSLRAFASTGEPWNPAPWWWLYEKVGNSKLPIINYSGGTEIAGGILMGNPLLPQKPCSFPAPCPGMDVDILDEDGNSVKPGQVGELVIKQPWIGMARGFWQEKERYLETYWSRFKNIWVHGDWAMRDSDGHWFILGRSDDTLKVAGKRVGPAEVESILVSHPAVTEAAVIGVPDETKGTAMVAFCVLRSEDTPVLMSAKREEYVAASGDEKRSEDTPVLMSAKREEYVAASGDKDKSVLAPLEDELKSLVARDMGKPLAPSKIHFVSALPKTRNAKVMRRVIRAAYIGEDPGDLSALEDPKVVDEIRMLSRKVTGSKSGAKGLR